MNGEMLFTMNWLKKHVSDHSCVNHRYQVITRLMTQLESRNSNSRKKTTRMDFLSATFNESANLIESAPGHEALWYHRRSLVILLEQHVRNIGSIGRSFQSETLTVDCRRLGRDRKIKILQEETFSLLELTTSTCVAADDIQRPVEGILLYNRIVLY